MSKPAEKPEVVQLPAEPPVAAPVSSRRAAAQRVREARDRLTSTSGTRPAFDRELLRQYAQTRISASYVVMLLVVATGVLFGFWMQPISAAAWTCGMFCIHAVIIRNCRKFLAEQASLTATRKWRTRFVLLDLLYGLCWTAILLHPASLDVASNTLMMFLMLLVIAVSSMLAASLPIAALAATAPVTAAIALNFVLGGTFDNYVLALLALAAEGIFRAARPSPAFDDAGDAGSARRKGRADRRARAGQSDFRRGAASRRIRQRRQVAVSGANEPRTADAAECDPRIFRGDEERNFRRACRAGLQGIFRRHPQFRRPPAEPDQRDSRPVADRGRTGTSSTKKRCRWCMSSPTAIIC